MLKEDGAKGESDLRTSLLSPLLVAVVLSGCQKKEAAAPEPAPIAIRVRPVQRVDRPAFVEVSGSVDARETVKAAFPVAGRIARITVREGQQFRKGEVLAELDATDYRNGWEAAKAQTAAAKAQYDKSLAGARAQELEQARLGYTRAEDEFSRLKLLFDKKSLAPNDFKKAEAAYLSAREQYEMAKQGARSEDKAAAKAMFEQAEAGERVARKRVDDSVLLAPFSGSVARRLNEPGETVGAGMPVLILMDLDPAEIRVGVPESDVALVRPGTTATILISALPGREFTGKVELVGVAAEPQSRTFTTRILVANGAGLLRAGMIAEARIQGAKAVQALTVPTQAIVRDPQGATLVYVYFPEQKRVHARRIEAGSVYGQEVEIAKGLKGDESIVVAGQQLVREGTLVAVEAARP